MDNQENNFNSDNQSVPGEVNSTPTENQNSVPDNSMNYGMNGNPQQNIPGNNYGDNMNPYDIPQQEQYIYPEGLTVVDDDNKKSAVPFIIIGVVAALIISLVLMFVCVPSLKHSLLRTFMPAEKYYQMVENDRIDVIRKLSEASEKNGTGIYADMAYDAKYGFKINPSEEIKEAGLDKIDVIFDGDFNLKSRKISSDTDVILNDGKIFDMSIIQDLEKGDSYVAVPILSDSYIFIDGNVKSEESENFDVESTCDFFDKLVENINSVEKSPKYKGKLKNLYVYEIKYDDTFRTALTEKIKPQLLEDDKTGNAIDKMGNTYEKFVDSFIEMFEELDSCKVFVDGNGKIVGRNFVLKNGNEFTYLIELKGRDMYSIVTAESETDGNSTIEFNLTKGKNGYSGKGTVIDEEKDATTDITIKDFVFLTKKDKFTVDGSIDMTFTVDDEEPFIIKMTSKATEEDGKFSIDINGIQDDIDMDMNIFFEYQKKADGPEEVKIPEKYFTTEQSDEYLKTADLDALTKAFTENEFFKVLFDQQNSGFGGNHTSDDYLDDDFDNDSDNDFTDIPEQDEEVSSENKKNYVDVEMDIDKMDFTIHGNKVYSGVTIGEIVKVNEADKMVKPGEEISLTSVYEESIIGVNNTDKDIPAKECKLIGYSTITTDKNYFDLAGIKPGSSRDDLKKYLPEAYTRESDTIIIYEKRYEQMIMLLYNEDKLVAISYTRV